MGSDDPEVPDRIGPYRITARLGAGGMGEVYEAYDDRLERTVAVKVVHGHRRDDDSARRRFRREARIVAGLKHPAIPPIYDVLSWDDGGDCLVMERVEGRTLAAILRDGPLELTAALKLFRQIAGGLAAAHAKGIVHRDLKSGNVMVTPDGDAKILDFGLAKSLALSETPLSVEGSLLGTFPCMSPEQAQGLEVDHRSDLFSLGALLYEALTGVSPFRGANVGETLARVCMHRQKPVRELDPAIPEELSHLVDRLLRKDPDQRPRSAGEVAAALTTISSSGTTGPGAAAPRPAPRAPVPDREATVLSDEIPADVAGGSAITSRRSRRWMLIPATIAALALAWIAARETGIGPAAPARTRPAVAVLGFDNAAPGRDSDWLSPAIAEVLADQLAIGGEIRTIPGSRVSEVRRDLGIEDLAAITGELWGRLHQNLGAGYFVLGEYRSTEDDGLLHLELRLCDAGGGSVLAEIQDTGSRGQLFPLLAAAADLFRRKLGAEALSPGQAVAAKASFPADPQTAEAYARGLARLRRSETLEAARWLEQAVAAAPEHPAPAVALAEARAALGEDRQARLQARRAKELLAAAARYPPGRKAELGARLSLVLQERERAVEWLESLYRSNPDQVDHALRLAELRLAMAQVDEARVIVEELGELPRPLSRDPRIDLLRASIHGGSPEEVARFARRAAERAAEIGARSQVARAWLTEAGALQDLGDHRQAARLLGRARRLFEELRDRRGAAKILESQAITASFQGRLEVAWDLYLGAEEIYREIGSRRDLARLLANKGNLQSERGRLDEAEVLYEEALAIYGDVGAESERATTMANLGSIFHEAAELGRALERYRQALELFNQLGHQQGEAAVLTNIAEVHFLRGRLDRAQELHQEALSTNIAGGDDHGRFYDLYRLGDVAAARGDAFVARQHYQEALDGMEAIGDSLTAAEVRTALAALELVEGDPQAAAELAGRAEEVARTQGAAGVRIGALVALGRSLLAQSRISEAQAIAEEVAPLAAASAGPRLDFLAAIFAARARAASGNRRDVAAALASLDRVLAETAERELMVDHFEARLARVEIALAAGLAGAGDELEILIREAGDLGFGGIVERAGRLGAHRRAAVRAPEANAATSA